jgi:hypothetical protein
MIRIPGLPRTTPRLRSTPVFLFLLGLLLLSGCAQTQSPENALARTTTKDLVRGLKACSAGRKIRVEVFPFHPYRADAMSTNQIARLFFEDVEHSGSESSDTRGVRSAERFRIRMIENLIRSPDMTDIVASRSLRELASREREFQMSHARPSTIQPPGHVVGASFAVVGRYTTKRGNRISLDLEAVDLTSNRICWIRTVSVPDR